VATVVLPVPPLPLATEIRIDIPFSGTTFKFENQILLISLPHFGHFI